MTVAVSVVVPTFNGGGTLEACLSSLVAQTRPIDEVIVVDDGSTDDSAAVAARYASEHPSVHLYRQRNAGVSAARNRGLRAAKGDFVGFVDPDDHVGPEMYGELLRGALETESPVAVLRRHTIGSPPAPRHAGVEVLGAADAVARLLQLRYPSSVWAHLYSRKALRGLRFDPRIGFFEDLLFNFEVLRRIERVALVEGDHYFYQPGQAGANSAPLGEKHLSSFVACASIRQTIAAESLPLWNELAHLEAHCLHGVVYKASSAPAKDPAVERAIGRFAQAIVPECRRSEIGWRRKLLVQVAALAPGSLLMTARLAIRARRAVASLGRKA